MKKILILSDANNLRLEQEVQIIQAALQLPKNRQQFEIVTEQAIQLDDLHRALLRHQPTIVHFCEFDSVSTGLALENNSGQKQIVSTEFLTRLFEVFKDKIECVVLNVSYNQAQASAINQHINYVVGINQAIADEAVIEFVTGFYEALSVDRDYEECFRFGCASITLQEIPESQIPVLMVKRYFI